MKYFSNHIYYLEKLVKRGLKTIKNLQRIHFSICQQFLIPLKEAGMKVSIPDLLGQWQNMRRRPFLSPEFRILSHSVKYLQDQEVKAGVTYYK